MKIRIILYSLIFLVFAASACAEQPIHVVISKGFKKRPVVAFPPVYLDASAKGIAGVQEMNELLYGDLKLSGLLSMLPQKGGVSTQGGKDTFSKTDYRAWLNTGAEFVIKTSVTSNLGVPVIRFSIHDVGGKKELVTNQRQGSSKALRKLGHRVSDEILIALTGKAGLGSTRLAFVSDRNGTKTIFSCDLQGKDVKQLVYGKALALSPDWGPRRETLLYTSYEHINPQVFLKHLASNKVDTIATFPGLNANGRLNKKDEIVFTASRDGNPEIYKINALTGKYKRLTRRKGVDATPEWSPDGKRIAFVSEAQGTPQVYTMDSEGQNIKRLTFSNSYNSSPAWSNDGRYLAFSTRMRRLNHLALYDFQSNRMEILISNMKNAEAPSFAPDSRHIAFASDVTGHSELYILDIETSEVTRVTKNLGSCMNPSWG